MSLTKTEKYGKLNTYDIAKILALVLMTVDHVGYFLLPEYQWLRVVGRLSAPIWLFLVGYSRSDKMDKNILFAGVILLLSQVAFSVDAMPLNILFVILICRFLLGKYGTRLEKNAASIGTFLMLLIWFLPSSMILGYGTAALQIALFGRLVRNHKANSLVMLYSMVLMLLHSVIVFNFSNVQLAVLVALQAGQFLWLKNFAIKPLKFDNACLKFLARHSLHYFVLHMIALMAISAFIMAPK